MEAHRNSNQWAYASVCVCWRERKAEANCAWNELTDFRAAVLLLRRDFKEADKKTLKSEQVRRLTKK